VSIHPVARGFARAADLYERARPSFPPEAVDFLAGRLDLRPGRTVLDLAAGTGKLTRLLVGTGADVVAVEPIEEMRAKLVEAAPSVRAFAGVAESLPLPDRSIDAGTVAQAFHWFDADRAYRELARVLRPGGGLALVWNTRDVSDPLQASIEAILKPYRDAATGGKWKVEYDAPARAQLFGDWEEWRHPWAQPFDRELLAARFASVSFVAALPDEERQALLNRILEAAAGLDEPFPLLYVTEVFICRRHTEAS
jgi:SAM-dependent methyltransferase